MKETGIDRATRPLKVLVVDDSAMMCKAIEQILLEDRDIGQVKKVMSGKEALQELSEHRYDVCTLDVHMPGMNGLTVLKNIMVKYPLPTLMVSAFTSEGSRITFEALRFGAVDFFKKPARDSDDALKEQAAKLRSRLKRASRVQVTAARYLRVRPRLTLVKGENEDLSAFNGITVMYGSTGCYSSVLSIIPHLGRPLSTPILVCMDNSEENVAAFMEYLKSYMAFPVRLAKGTLPLEAKTVYFVPEGYAAHFDKKGGKWELTCERRPIESDEEGAIDLTLLSASESFGSGVQAIFVSGDSGYGVTGAREVARNNGKILVQRPQRCLAPANPSFFQREFGAEALEPIEISERISKWTT